MKIVKEVLKYIGFLIALFAGLLIVHVLSYGLPNKNIQKHVDDSIVIFENEGTYYTPFQNNQIVTRGYQYDNWTDSLILLVSRDTLEGWRNVVDRSLGNYNCGEDNPVTCLKHVSIKAELPEHEYSRYWFGTSAVLRVFLLFFDLYYIRYIFLVILFALFIVLMAKIAKEYNVLAAIVYAFVLLNIGFITLGFSLQYLPNTLITLIASIVIAYNYKKEKFNKYIPYLFLVIGTLTGYFDLLTYPLVTFGIPFLFYILMLAKDNNKVSIKNIILIGMSWLIGYVGMFIYKFTVSSIVLHKNVFKTSIEQIMFRTDTGDALDVVRKDSIAINYDYIFNEFNQKVLYVYYAFMILYMAVKKRFSNINLKNAYNIVLILLVGMLPMAWYYLLSNHSYIHNFMTYRTASISLFALVIIPLLLIKDKNEVVEVEEEKEPVKKVTKKKTTKKKDK